VRLLSVEESSVQWEGLSMKMVKGSALVVKNVPVRMLAEYGVGKL
jgi:hypothetical protein